MYTKLFPFIPSLLALLSLSTAQRPSDTSICDYYTTALLKENNGTTQAALVILVVNTAVVGNYSAANVGISVPGILAPGMYNGTSVNLLPYFDGGLASSNRGGSSGVSINFLDDGGATPLMANMPANGTNSNQYQLLTHLYSYFGVLLGCSKVGTDDFPGYTGEVSQNNVHKFMDLDAFQVGWFIEQVGLAASSFGVADADVAAVGMALNSLFGYKCSPPTTVVPAQGAQLQAICEADNCHLAPNSNCSAYTPEMTPGVSNESTSVNATASMSMMSGAMTSVAGTPVLSGSQFGSSGTKTDSSATKGATNSALTNSTGMAAHFGPAAALVGAAALAFAL